MASSLGRAVSSIGVKPLKGVPSTAWSLSATALGRFSSPATTTPAGGITAAHVGSACEPPGSAEESAQSGVCASQPNHWNSRWAPSLPRRYGK